MTKTKLPLFIKQENNEISMGIAQANIMMTAANQWIDIKRKRVEALEKKEYKNLKYILSIKNV